ncbi:MAG: helix-turn-helix domain-containing protein [Planctomycetaceae bacterium]|nr:helix-turn-helix domain-containing protein [Planctomycetaceae bacterium]
MTVLPLRERLAMLTVAEAAAELCVSEAEIERLLELGQVPCLRLGNFGEQVRIIRCELLEYQQRLQTESTTDCAL